MKLLRQAALHYLSGKSDKVYEIDLCEVADGQFVVNFRYGRRGSNLRDGTKTALPVDRAAAEAVFDKLLAEKLAKGYRRAGEAGPAVATAATPKSEPTSDRDRAILEALRRRGGARWPLSRVAWRAGELGIEAAEPLLCGELRTASDPMLQYALVWALGRCGSEASVPALRRAAENGANPAVRQLAVDALGLISDAERARISAGAEAALPAPIGDLAAAIGGQPPRHAAALRDLYRVERPEARQALIEALETAAFQGEAFAAVRGVFKAAELRRDPRVFGLVAHRIERERGRHVGWYQSTKPAFTRATREYLRRRVWRTLRRLGEAGSPDYVRMATGVLLPFRDADSARGWAFNHILYGGGERRAPDERGRQESFPELWDRSPEALLHLLDESRCEPVHHMAARALEANPGFVAGLDIEALSMLLAAPYAVTAELGFAIARARHDPAAPDPALIRAVAASTHEPARHEARRWIAAAHARLVADSALWAALIVSRFADNRRFARQHLLGRDLGDQVARLIIGRVIAELAAGPAEGDGERLGEAAGVLCELFGRLLATVGEPVIRDLLAAPALEVQELAARLILGHRDLGQKPPDDLLLGLLDSAHPSIQTIGARLLGQLSDDDLLRRGELVASLATHERAELRDAIRPALVRLVAAHPELGRALAADLARKLLSKNAKGVPADVVILFRAGLGEHAGDIDKDMVLQLLRARSPHAQELGGLLMISRLTIDDLSLAEIIDLASHDILEVRRAARQMCEDNLERLRLAMNGAVRLLDARWPDTRDWARELFSTRFSARELTPQVLVGICDSVRPEVQRFGQELIARHFEREHGAEYLLKLSEHPVAAMQRFATSYLEGHAAGRPDRLRELEPFFVTVLSRVNKGRVARLRVIELLAAEARADRRAAEVAARVFGRASATMAVTHKEPMIAAMVAIKRRWPDIDLPLRPVAVERRGVSEAGDGV